MSNKFSLAIFDLDGTLADTSQLIFDSFNFVMWKYKSMEMTPSQIMSYFGPPEEIAIKNILGSDNFDSIWLDYLGYYEDHLNETEVFAGIPELLRALKKTGSHLAIFTGKGNNTTESTLKHHGIRDLFDVIVTGSIVKNHKPSPEGVELALSTLRVEPSMAVLVGDSLSDYRAATSAGIHFIAAMYDSLAKNRFDDVKCVKANSIRELSALLLPQHAHLD